MAKLICPTHGYYDASEGTCPMCRAQQFSPAAPAPLGSEDNMPTEIGGGGGGYSGGGGDAPTEIGAHSPANPAFTDETQISPRMRNDVTEIDGPADTGPIAILWVKDGPRRGQIHRIKDGTVVGRSKADILLDEPKASSSHAKFTYEEEQFNIWDFGTRNGTFVNGERIRAATALEENDEVKIGDTTFVLKVL